MCGIVGILFKNGTHPEIGMTTGEALTEMLGALLHRGPDSCGFAMYKDPLDEDLRLRFLVQEGLEKAEDVARIKEALTKHGAEIIKQDSS